MTLQYVVQTIVSLLNIGSVPLTRKGKALGWLMVALAQSIFACYSLLTGQYFFIIMNLGMLSVSLWAAHSCLKESKTRGDSNARKSTDQV